MQVVGEIIWLAIVGALGALPIWLIVRRSRQRTRRIAEQLSAEITPTSRRLVISANRKEHAGWALFFGLIVAMGIAAAVDGRGVTLGVRIALGLVSLALAPLAVFYARRATRRGPHVILDGDGLTVVPLDKSIRWDEVEQIYLRQRRVGLGPSVHHLVIELKPRASGTVAQPQPSGHAHGGSITLQLETLSMDWNDVAAAIQARFGRRIVA